jgi:REP element-mobilizing transposase RayT
MARPRKKHVQIELPRLDKNGQRRGGKRKGAGRPAKGKRASEWHKRRLELSGREPILVTLRIVAGVGSLRRRHMYRAVRLALIATALRDEFRIVHFSIQGNHLHLLVEAESKTALSRGIQGFCISAAKHINAELVDETGARRRGQVFADRYHARVITSPRQCQNALSYVLNNWRRHKEDRASFAKTWRVDPYSSGINFGGWTELADSMFLFGTPPTYERPLTCFPRTWLLRTGWMMHGLIDTGEVPGAASSS